MRRLTKTEIPLILKSNQAAWRQAFEDHVAANGGTVGSGAPAHYRHADVREALRIEVAEKCAYCESCLLHVTYDHIEHILPRKHRPDLVVTWSNLTLACPKCNQSKSDYYVPSAPLVHPYEDDPEAEIEFEGPMARTDGHGPGYRTISVCDLNRGALVIRRLGALTQVEQLLRQAASLGDPIARGLVVDEARRLAADDAEYASVVRRYLERRGVTTAASSC